MIKKIGLVLEVIVFLAVGAFILQKCHKQEQVLTTPVLKENEKEKIIIDTARRTVTRVVRTKNGTGKDSQTVKSTTGARQVVVVEDDQGNIEVSAITTGVCFEPGLAIYYSDRARLGLDVQIAYWRSYGLLLGAGVNMGEEPRTVRAHVAISRNLPLNFLSNTSAFIGVDNKKDVVCGLRIQF